MNLLLYHAVTGAELTAAVKSGKPLAWMACRLSSSGNGISGVPPALPPDSMLMLTDEMPAQGHDPVRVAQELAQAAQSLNCANVLLDFQRPRCVESEQIVRAVLQAAPCPVGVSESHAAGFDCPVLVSPPPLWTSLEEQIDPWRSRQIWLEAVQEDAVVTVTDTGSHYAPCPAHGDFPFLDARLQVAYRIETTEDAVCVYLHRGQKELDGLLAQASHRGICTAVGLYQQLCR